MGFKIGIEGRATVWTRGSTELYSQPIKSKEEADSWIAANETSIEPSGILKSSFIPTRVDTLANLAKDLFLPTFINQALKVDGLFFKIVASLILLPWDMLTLVFRLITLPYRLCCSKPPELPVVKLIKDSPAFREALQEGVVHISAVLKNIRATEHSSFGGDASKVEEVMYRVSTEVCLKPLPAGNFVGKQTQNLTTIFQKIGGQWNCVSSVSNPLRD